MTGSKRVVGYLSGAPRVSTRPEAEASGPRAHVLGVMDGFRQCGWGVEPYIVGDSVPTDWIRGSERKLEASHMKRLAADVVRFGMGQFHARRAWRRLGGTCDWVYERFGAYQSLGGLFSRHGVPWIVETNAPIFYEAKAERKAIAFASWARRLELSVYRRADVLVTITKALKDILVDAAAIPAEKVLVVPNGVDTERFSPCAARPKRFFEGPTIGFAGALIAWQALDLLLECIADLDREGVNWNVVIAGSGPMRESWEARVAELGLAGQVAFLGRVPWSEIPALVSGVDLGYSGQVELQVGKMYLSPLKLYEYLAMGKPVIASAFEDACRVIRPSETGFLFQGGDKESLKSALRSAWRSRPGWQEMGVRARDLIVREHSWRQRVSSMIGGVEGLVQARKIGSHEGR